MISFRAETWSRLAPTNDMIARSSAYHTKMINEEERTDKGEENEAEKYAREDKERIKGGGGGRGIVEEDVDVEVEVEEIGRERRPQLQLPLVFKPPLDPLNPRENQCEALWYTY
ncbi:hypothetical protein KQX54_011345 [Cotesia glomerata]|uniref:Uncharacterized protein n=1 Tax=Cotesia glomerata TaxID=32391 RepID=A0AAV7J0P1_COTGL|nr:hypothetical protein KQX54_011345 [Cotesia glomerata]